MKKFILMAFSLVSIAITAQQNEFAKMLKNYENSNFAKVIEIGPDMMGMADGFILEDMEELAPIMKDIKAMKIIVFEEDIDNNFLQRKDSIYENFTTVLGNSNYKSLMNIKDDDERIKMFSKPLEGEKLKDVVIAIQEDDEVVLIYLEGIFNRKEISRIINDL